MEAFDGCTIAPMMGCASAAEYYTQASCQHVLSRVRVPLLFLSARNDPVAPADVIQAHPFVTDTAAPLLLAITREGGHSMAWPEGWSGAGRAWSAAVLVEWLGECVSREYGERLSESVPRVRAG